MGTVINKKRKFLLNALVMTGLSLLMNTVGMAFRVYQSNKIGAEGIGLLQLVLSVYFMTTNLAVAGIHYAVTRLVSEHLATGNHDAVRQVMKRCLQLCLLFGCGTGLLVFFAAEPIGLYWLRDGRTILSLKVLALGLPFFSISCCTRGYYLAVRNAMKPASGQTIEQIINILVTLGALHLLLPYGIEYACCGIAAGMTAGEIAGCLYIRCLYLWEIRKKFPRKTGKSIHPWNILSISLPISGGSTLRTALSAVENALIPAGLKKYGASYQESLSNYGVIKGMAMPVLAFPSAFLSAFSMLLVPEMAEAKAVHNQKTINRIASQVFQLSFLFSILIVGIFFFFADDFGLLLYQDPSVGSFLRILAPLIPFMYLDSIVDAMLKGLNEQVYGLKVNTADSSFRVLLSFLLLPLLGMKGYLIITFFSTIFNASLSMGRLIKVSRVTIHPVRWLLLPSAGAVLSGLASAAAAPFLGKCFSLSLLWGLIIKIAICVLLYFLFLLATGVITKEELRRLHLLPKTSGQSSAISKTA